MTRLTLRTDELSWREIDGEIVALEGRHSIYLAANSSGGMLWRMLARGATRDELAAALSGAYDIDAAAAGTDTDLFLEQMRNVGLLSA
jgi:hypothetical protein